MKIKIFSVSLIFIFLIIFLIFYKGLQNDNIYKPSKIIEVDILIYEARLLLNDKIIKSKQIFNSNDFFLLNIWASWCVPCRDEHKFLMNISRQQKIKIVGLNYKDNMINAKNFLDPDGIIAIEWGAFGVPETFLIHKKKIIKKIIGPIDENTYFEIESLIK